jgi:hypothetical protein
MINPPSTIDNVYPYPNAFFVKQSAPAGAKWDPAENIDGSSPNSIRSGRHRRADALPLTAAIAASE